MTRRPTRSLRRRPTLAACVGAVTALALTACSSGTPGAPSTEATNRLEVLSWWTSASEKPALDQLFTDYKAAHPGVEVVDLSVAGGSGSNVQVILAQRLKSGTPPDVWQTFAGASVQAYATSGQVADVSSIYASGAYAQSLPPGIKDSMTRDGKQFGVPTGAHRSNVLFYNTAALSKAGINPPAAGYTLDAFVADLAKAKSAGVPLCLGGKDTFTAAELFENILLAQIGPQGWTKIVGDSFDWNGADARAALATFSTVLDAADPQAGGLSWDQATAKLAKGECAFESMNDSAYGELVRGGAEEGATFGAVAFPGTDASFVAVIDTFVVAKNAANGKNALDFLTTLTKPETQLAFNKLKGSVPLGSDVAVDQMSPYQQASAAALRAGEPLLSIVHGEAMSPQFQQGFYDAVASFVDSRDAGAFSRTLSEAVNRRPAIAP